VTGTPWATEAAMSTMDAGGNAFDAAVAALLMLNVTAGEASSFPGIAPTLIYHAASDEIVSYVGAGTAPAAATLDSYTNRGHETIPDLDILAQLLPASPDVMIRLLADYGTKSFEEVSRPAIRRAREGFPVTTTMHDNLDFSLIERIGFSILLPYNAEVYLDRQWWRPLHKADLFTRPDLAETWQTMVDAERDAVQSGATRSEALLAVRTHFYEGPPAQAILALHEKKGGLFTATDLANYRGRWETPYSSTWSVPGADGSEYAVYTHTGWTQGLVVPLALNILEHVDIQSLEHNSPPYVHAVVQALDLALADREAYLGDPAFVDVPEEILLSNAYAESRSRLMSRESFRQLPQPGVIDGYEAWVPPEVRSTGESIQTDTSQLVVADRAGNVVAITPSDFPKSPMVPETGMTLGNRMVQFRLDERSPTSLEPGKRPRVTPHAVMVFRDGAPWLAFNTPGGDMQTQALVQVLLNLTVFGMDPQAAIDSPRFRSRSVPSSFSPHEAEPGVLWLEQPLHERTGIELAARGYEVLSKPTWDNDFGAVGAILRDGGRWIAVADPREATWAMSR
ncbi:MAG: gamma-glutamyltransferase family protein, partial [Spirochaetota bacterium]